MPPIVSRILVLILVVQVGLPLVLSLARNKLIFLPSDRPTAEEGLSQLRGLDARVVRIARPDGRQLAAYDVRPPEGDPDERPVVLFFHGNAGNIGVRAGFIGWFAQGTGARVVMPDYSGYGGNAGSPSEGELDRDALAAYDWLVCDGVAPSRIVVYGSSIGGAPATRIAAEKPVAGLVMQSCFSSLSSAAMRVYPWLPLGALFTAGAYPNAERLRALEMPILLVHGTRDRIMPLSESERLLEAAPEGAELVRVEGAGHNDLFEIAGTAYLRSLRERFAEWTR